MAKGGKGKGGGSEEHITTASTAPPGWVQPYLEGALGSAQNLYQNQPLYQGGLSPMAQQGFQGMYNTAQSPQLIQPALGLAQQTMAGDFLGGDALRSAARSELDDVIGGTLGGAERAGMSGSTGRDYALGRGVTAAMAPVYQRERQLQQQAMGMAPGLEASRYMPSQQMLSSAIQQQGLEERYYQEPWERLQRYTGLMMGPASMAGTQQTNAQPIYEPDPMQQILGLGMTGLGLFL